MKEAVIFDLDGTLINLPINYEILFREFGKVMKTPRIRPITKTVARLDEKTKERVFRIWERIEIQALKGMTVNSQGMELYRKYTDRPKALVTMQGIRFVTKMLETLDLQFDFIVTREDSLNRARQLEIAQSKLEKPFSDILFVGNTDEDKLAASKVGCDFVKVEE